MAETQTKTATELELTAPDPVPVVTAAKAAGLDVVVRANPAAADAGWDELDLAVARQLEKACRR